MMYRLKMIGSKKDSREKGAYNAPTSRETILRTAEESAVLLKNENYILPLDEKKVKKTRGDRCKRSQKCTPTAAAARKSKRSMRFVRWRA